MINSQTIKIIPDKLYWISDKQPPKNQKNAYFFCIDNDLVYEPFFADFGPLNLGMMHRFVSELDKLMKDYTYKNYLIYHYTSIDSAKRANSAFLMCAYCIIILKQSADVAWQPFQRISPPFPDYRDASYGPCSYKCSILDCLRGLEYAIRLKWYDIKTFNLRDYEYYERVENGDLNWTLPGKFISFSGPQAVQRDQNGMRYYTPEDYIPIFKQMNVGLVIRLNKKQYEASSFTKHGIKHLDLFFMDGTTPSPEIIQQFLKVCESETQNIAVHCKAGLGRTGVLIGCYAMKHYKFQAAAFIGWIRICRPGSILGPQQYFLNEMQSQMHKLSESSPIYQSIRYLVDDEDLVDRFQNIDLDEKMNYSPIDKRKQLKGDYGQAERLTEAKRNFGQNKNY